MSFARSWIPSGLAFIAALVVAISCTSGRPPAYVYTPPPSQESVRGPDRAERERVSRPAARQTGVDRAPARVARPSPVATPAAREPAVLEVADVQPTAGTGLFAQPTDPDSASGEFDNYAPVTGTGYRLRNGDPLIIQLRGIPESDNHELVVDDQGYINLPFIPPIRAEGLTPSQLQRLIQDRYIEERIYRQITVNVILPMQHYFVRGEVRNPGRFPLTAGMTILKAIAAAGGYTEFANPRRINIIRAGETMVENARQMEQNPEQDLDVRAGDVIIVPRSIF